MTRLLILSLFILLSQITFSQIQIKGRVKTITKFEVNDEGVHKVISETFPTQSFFHLSDEKFFVNGTVRTPVYKLFDKDTTRIYGDLVISYYSFVKDKMYLIAAREDVTQPNTIILAVIPFLEPSKYVEFNLKVANK